jgi:CheY-like chemotaxis protein
MDVVVLLVDPDAAMRGFCQRLLERRGMSVLVASQPSEALHVLAQAGGDVDVVVTPRHLVTCGDIALGARMRALAPRVSIVCTGIAAPVETRVRGRLTVEAVPARRGREARPDGLLEGDALARAVLSAARGSVGARRGRSAARARGEATRSPERASPAAPRASSHATTPSPPRPVAAAAS